MLQKVHLEGIANYRMIQILPDIIEFGASKFGHKLAFGNGLEDITYQGLLERAHRGAQQLGSGGPVMLYGISGPDWMAGFFSILCSGRCVVPVPANASGDYLKLVIEHARIETVVCSSALKENVCEQNIVELDSLGKNANSGQLPVISPDDTALIAFTSGSTQSPKAVVLTHANIVANIHGLVAVQQVSVSDTFLSILPLHHLFELVVGNLAPMVLGASIIYPQTLLPNRIIKALQTENITYMLVVPALLGLIANEVMEQLIDKKILPKESRDSSLKQMEEFVSKRDEKLIIEINRIIGSTLKSVVAGGAGISPLWNTVFKLLGRELYVGYGLTEASPILTCTKAADCPAGSVGRPLPNVKLKISDGNEILACGPNIMQGYLGEAKHPDSWLSTGDLGAIDSQGNLFIKGRSKEVMVTSAGETLFPEEIEPYYQHDDFHECCVVPLSGEDGNDRPALVIYPKDELADIKKLVNKLAAHAPARLRVRDYIEIDHPLPRTELGKIRRRALADMIERRANE